MLSLIINLFYSFFEFFFCLVFIYFSISLLPLTLTLDGRRFSNLNGWILTRVDFERVPIKVVLTPKLPRKLIKVISASFISFYI